jgi:ribosomal RNA-processing protein 8
LAASDDDDDASEEGADDSDSENETDSEDETANDSARDTSRAPMRAVEPPKKPSLVDKMRAKLSGGQFRMLNEALYTTTGDEALRMVEDQPGMFSAYHAGFREQTKEWPVRPVDACLKWLATQPKTLRVADFGCGDAELAKRAPQKTVHSFDLESEAKGVVACNMANVPLDDASVEVAVFSLSLMGTDYGSFMEEAHRVRPANANATPFSKLSRVNALRRFFFPAERRRTRA